MLGMGFQRMRAFAGVTALTLTVASGAAIRWLWANIPADAGHRFESLPAARIDADRHLCGQRRYHALPGP